MKGYLLFIISLTSCVFACKDRPATKTVVDPYSGFTTHYSVIKNDTTYHGPYTKSDSAGVLLERGIYKEGELHGIREILFPDGKVKIRERYVNGKIADLYEYYFPNGNLQLKGYYVDGAMYGPWKKYDDQGNLLEVVTMVNNEEYGPFVEYNAAGKIQAEGMYLHGPNEDGLLNLYDDDGELYKKMLCDSGVCITTWQKK